MSFVVRIDDMPALIESWKQMLATANGSQEFTMNDEVFRTLKEWPRINYFYYCDDANGNTLRIYDTEHFERFGGSYYLERDNSQSKGHYERVILRGKNMWADDEANLKRPESLRKRFRDNPAWGIFSATQAPIRPGSLLPADLGLRVVRRGNLSTVDIEGGMVRERRLWYFESLNQPPVFNPPRQSVRPTVRSGTTLPSFADSDVPDLGSTYKKLLADKKAKEAVATPLPAPRSALEIIESLHGHRLFQTAEEVRRHLQEERNAWDR